MNLICPYTIPQIKLLIEHHCVNELTEVYCPSEKWLTEPSKKLLTSALQFHAHVKKTYPKYKQVMKLIKRYIPEYISVHGYAKRILYLDSQEKYLNKQERVIFSKGIRCDIHHNENHEGKEIRITHSPADKVYELGLFCRIGAFVSVDLFGEWLNDEALSEFSTALFKKNIHIKRVSLSCLFIEGQGFRHFTHLANVEDIKIETYNICVEKILLKWIKKKKNIEETKKTRNLIFQGYTRHMQENQSINLKTGPDLNSYHQAVIKLTELVDSQFSQSKTIKDLLVVEDFDLLFRKVAADKENFIILEFLLTHTAVLDIDRASKGKNSGNALDIALRYSNQTAVEALKKHNLQPSLF